MSAADIVGWSPDIVTWQKWVAGRIPRGGSYLEIGVFLGQSLARMGELRPDIDLYAVDPWIDDPSLGYAEIIKSHGGLWPAFLYMMSTHAPDVMRRTRIFRGSAKILKLDIAVDCLFIDGAHDRLSVLEDIDTFGPNVKRGGIISGHDYNHTYQGVIDAVSERFTPDRVHYGMPGSKACWWVEQT